MPLKIVTPKGKFHLIHSKEDFEKFFHVKYLSSLQFDSSYLRQKIEKHCAKALRKGWISPRQKWLGVYYAADVHREVCLDLTIAWIDELVGYGVWTNRNIPAHSYIGEYTGILRKRRFFGRRKNHYCFDYTIGEGKNSSYVIDAQDYGNHTRWINHSVEANIEPVSIYCEGLTHVILFAKKLILSGTQLCYDYGDNYWKKRKKPIPLKEIHSFPFYTNRKKSFLAIGINSH